MNHVNPEIIRKFERVLEEKLLSSSGKNSEDYIAVDDFENIDDEKCPSKNIKKYFHSIGI
jgi:hypothetical protein